MINYFIWVSVWSKLKDEIISKAPATVLSSRYALSYSDIETFLGASF